MKPELLNLNNVLTSLYQNIKIEEELFIKRKNINLITSKIIRGN